MIRCDAVSYRVVSGKITLCQCKRKAELRIANDLTRLCSQHVGILVVDGVLWIAAEPGEEGYRELTLKPGATAGLQPEYIAPPQHEAT